MTVLLPSPVPPFVDVTALVVLSYDPAAVPVIVTWNEQLELAPIDTPDMLSEPGAGLIPPPPHPTMFEAPDNNSAEGTGSLNATPVAVTAFGFVIVTVNVVCPLSGIDGAPRAKVIVGGAITVKFAVLLVVPGPLSVELMMPVVLFLTPAVVPFTLKNI